MKLKVLIATLFASFALVACGEGDSNSSNVQSSNSIDGPATTGVAGTTTPTQSLAEEAEAAKTVSADDSKADESTEVVEKEEEEIPVVPAFWCKQLLANPWLDRSRMPLAYLPRCR